MPLSGSAPMRYDGSVGKGLQHSSGRVIALGRLMLATLFMLAIWVDASQPSLAPTATYVLLLAYVGFAAAVVVATWNNWWLDARLAGPAHTADVMLFMALVLLTAGYTSPFFTFFTFLLLSAAIRWGWRATALTAVLLVLLYILAGVIVVESNIAFDLQRFVVRTAHLAILSVILIWFGVNQFRPRLYPRDEQLLGQPSLDESPLEVGARAAMEGVRASSATLIWRDRRSGEMSGVSVRQEEVGVVSVPPGALATALATSPFLYDLRHDRALRRDHKRNFIAFVAGDVIGPNLASTLGLREGLAIPVRSDDGEGELFLEGVRNLSTDHIALGDRIAADVADHLQRRALLKAVEEGAEARSRLSLARDLHDSVVQFLAGAAFRLEAIKRSEASGRAVDGELDELKQLVMEEQRELRSFISALRSGPQVALNELAVDLKGLADRLSRQWDVQCDFSARPAELMLPTRVHLDALQLMREAVANAVRHAEAKSVTVKLSAAGDNLRLEFVNDGSVPKRGAPLETPVSLKERVDQAGGTLDMARGMGVMKISISLPIPGVRR